MAIQWTGLFANVGYSSANNKTQDDAVTGMQDTLYVTGPGYGAYEAVVRLYNSTGALVASVNVSGGGGALSAPPPVRFVDNGTVYSYSLEVVRGYIPTEDADGIVIRLVGGASKRFPSPMSVTPSGDVQFGGAVVSNDLAALSLRSSITVYDTENYTQSPDGGGREIALHVYPEGIAPYVASDLAKLERLRVGGETRMSLKPRLMNTQNKQTNVVTVPLSAKGSAPFAGITVNVVRTKFSAVKTLNRTFYPLLIGDSISATEMRTFDGALDGGWNLMSMVKEFAVMDAIDANAANKTVPLGTIGNLSGAAFNTGAVVYKGVSRPIRAFSEGRGGWCAATYLRHPVNLSATTGASASTRANGPATWQFLGLETANGTYVNDYAHNSLMRVTRAGLNAHNYGSDLWLYLQLRTEWTGPAVGTGWTDNGTNRGYIDTAMAAIFATPDNPFWENSANSFRIQNWSNRYKTIDNNGARLVVGSTAGTKITAGNLNDIDVNAEPNCIFIELGENDRWNFPENPTQTTLDLVAMRDAIDLQFSWMGANKPPVKFLFTRSPGSYSPAADPSVVRQMIGSHTIYKLDLMQRCVTAGLDVLDVYTTADTDASSWNSDRYLIDSRGRAALQMTGFDTIHPGISSLRCIAYQMYSWMIQRAIT